MKAQNMKSHNCDYIRRLFLETHHHYRDTKVHTARESIYPNMGN